MDSTELPKASIRGVIRYYMVFDIFETIVVVIITITVSRCSCWCWWCALFVSLPPTHLKRQTKNAIYKRIKGIAKYVQCRVHGGIYQIRSMSFHINEALLINKAYTHIYVTDRKYENFPSQTILLFFFLSSFLSSCCLLLFFSLFLLQMVIQININISLRQRRFRWVFSSGPYKQLKENDFSCWAT